jgi:hypothetical protein
MEMVFNQRSLNLVSTKKKDTEYLKIKKTYTQESEIQMKIIKKGMARYPNMLRKLAE